MLVCDKPQLKGAKDWLRLIVCGICMGSADIVPGISGGTIAFIMGFYNDLLASIKSFNGRAALALLTLRFKLFFREVGWEFLLALLTGIAIAFITLSHVVTYVLGHEVYRVYLYAAFLGLIIASVIFCSKQLKGWRWRHVVSLAAGALIAFILTDKGLKPKESGPVYDVYIPVSWDARPLENYDDKTNRLLDVPEATLSAMMAKEIITKTTPVFSRKDGQEGIAGHYVDGHFHLGINWWIVCCGAIAVSAMLLPGISGSYLLTILGVYPLVIGALADFLHGAKHLYLDSEALFVLVSMLIGIVVGAIVFSYVVSWLLSSFHDMTIAALTGFMIGALRSVWPFWSYEYVLIPLKLEKGPQLTPHALLMPDIYAPLFWQALGFASCGFALVFAIEWAANRKGRSTG